MQCVNAIGTIPEITKIPRIQTQLKKYNQGRNSSD